MKSRSIEFDNIDQELSEQPDNSNKEINTINQNNYNELPVNNSIDDMIEKQAEVNDLIKSISWLSVDENWDSGILTYDNMQLPRIHQYIVRPKMTIHGINIKHVLGMLLRSTNTTSMYEI